MKKLPWEGAFPPFRIFGNLYFVGSVPASTHVVDTGEGLIIFDPGYHQNLHMVIDGMYRLGLNPYDIKYIFNTHGHIDHLGATRALSLMTGAKTVLGRADRQYANGELDLTYAAELGMHYQEVFEPDILWEDGESLTLGRTTVTCMATPGHTPGALSYFFPVTDGEKTYRACLHGGMGINTMSREYLEKYGLPFSCRDEFVKAMERLSREPADIFLGNHMQHNYTPERYEQVMAGDKEAFVHPGESGEYALWAIKNLRDMIDKENGNG
ncbi:MAG: MBL fold metallo-hydrolase [Lachnospiraceae bacterium]|nr:MBL fold metallo-hydrolase [Lachnospiraceae bacterium]